MERVLGDRLKTRFAASLCSVFFLGLLVVLAPMRGAEAQSAATKAAVSGAAAGVAAAGAGADAAPQALPLSQPQSSGAASSQPARVAATSAGGAGSAELVVATRVLPPFVIDEGAGKLGGFSIDLWRAIAAEAGLRTRFQPYTTLPELLSGVRSQSNPVGISAVSITSEREETLDFSQPMFRSGLQIMVSSSGNSLFDTLRSFVSPTLLQVLGIILLVLLVPAHIAWFIHRFSPQSDWPVSRSYFPGIFQAFYWSGEKMIGTAEGAPGGWLGRLFNNVWSFLCVMVLASFTALIASALTLSSLRGDISGPGDLVGKRVATVEGSTSAAYLRSIKAQVEEYPDFAQAAAALVDGQNLSRPVAAVYDAPIILYYANHEGAGRVDVVGEPFKAENYGIVFPLGSDLRRTVNAALLKVSENGTYQQIYDKWFGAKEEEK